MKESQTGEERRRSIEDSTTAAANGSTGRSENKNTDQAATAKTMITQQSKRCAEKRKQISKCVFLTLAVSVCLCCLLLSLHRDSFDRSPPSSVGRAQGPKPCGRGFEPHGGCCCSLLCLCEPGIQLAGVEQFLLLPKLLQSF